MKQAWEIETGEIFIWNDCVYRITGWDRTNGSLNSIIVRRVMFKMDGRWHHYKTADDENFNPYCDVQPCRLEPVPFND